MLLFQTIAIVLISFLLKDIKSEELQTTVSNTAPIESTATVPTAGKESDINPLNTSIDPLDPLTWERDLNLDNILSNPSENLPPSAATTSMLNDFKDIETTPSWELIYPDQSSTTKEISESSTSTATSTNTISTTTTATTETSQISNLPKYFKVDDVTNCQKFFSTCLKQVLANVVPKLKDGNKYLHIPSLDPIHFNATAFQYNSGPFSGYITIRYALIYGLTNMKFKKIEFYKLEDSRFKARLSMVVPKLYAVGAYKGDMHVNNVRVRPRGEFNVTLSGLGIEMVTLGTVVRQEQHMFLKLTKNNATTTLRETKINATGIFPDQRLNDIVLNVANQYSRDLFNIVMPETRNNWLPILTDVLNGALAMVPFDFLK